MKIKNVIRISALLLNKPNVISHIDGKQTDENTIATVNAMLDLANLVINELASTYVPMIKNETVSIQSGKVYYTDLTERASRIISVTDLSGNDIAYKNDAKCVYVQSGNVIIQYEFFPRDYDLEQEFFFSKEQVTERILSYALCAEECLREARFDEAVSWHTRYVQEISLICCPKNSHIKQRRWE